MSTDAKTRMAEKTVEASSWRRAAGAAVPRLGKITFGGKERDFKGGALRIRRRGVRNVTGFWGHAWQSAVFRAARRSAISPIRRGRTASRPITRASSSWARAS